MVRRARIMRRSWYLLPFILFSPVADEEWQNAAMIIYNNIVQPQWDTSVCGGGSKLFGTAHF
jgi:hypothetical protein